MIPMDPTNPEILHAGELFSRIVDYRANLLKKEASWVDAALHHMDKVNDLREMKNRRLFMSTVARNTDVIGSLAGVDSIHDPNLASNIPGYLIPTEDKITPEHIAAVNESVQNYQSTQENPSEADVRVAELRHKINVLSTPLTNAELRVENDQFTIA